MTSAPSLPIGLDFKSLQHAIVCTDEGGATRADASFVMLSAPKPSGAENLAADAVCLRRPYGVPRSMSATHDRRVGAPFIVGENLGACGLNPDVPHFDPAAATPADFVCRADDAGDNCRQPTRAVAANHPGLAELRENPGKYSAKHFGRRHGFR